VLNQRDDLLKQRDDLLKQRDELSKQLRDLSTNHNEQLQSLFKNQNQQFQSLSKNHDDERAEILKQSESRRAQLKQARDQIDQLTTQHCEAEKRIEDLELQLSAEALQLSTSSAALRQSQQELNSARAQNQRLLTAAPRPSSAPGSGLVLRERQPPSSGLRQTPASPVSTDFDSDADADDVDEFTLYCPSNAPNCKFTSFVPPGKNWSALF
jgi:small-conductance mechanosensitive channel